jgi:hypothetical protein
MSVRGWAVGVASTAAVVAGLVGIQSGIVGTAALPILPHRAVASVPDGAELPAPAEVGAPPPSAGRVQQASVVSAEVAPEQRTGQRPPKRAEHTGKPAKPDKDKDEKAGEGPGRYPGKDSGTDPDHKSDRKPAQESGTDSGGGPGQH